MPFYPNECFVCKKTSTLQRCNNCNMISYCGEVHNKKYWTCHKTFCKVLSVLLKRKGLSHIYENLKGIDKQRWIAVRESTLEQVTRKMSRPLSFEEREMLLFPRVCFVCYDARQKLLTNCPNCPLASFCKDHPSSSIHDKCCLLIRQSHDRENNPDPTDKIVSEIIRTNKFEIEKSSMTRFLSVPLTLYNAFLKVNQHIKSELVIHIDGMSYQNENSWKCLLHLLPDINSLTIVIAAQEKNLRKSINLCKQCLLKKKTLLIEYVGSSYGTYILSDSFKQPNFVAVCVIPSSIENYTLHSLIPCPIAFIIDTEDTFKFYLKNLRSFTNRLSITYDGLNEFAPIYPTRKWDDWDVCISHKFLIIGERVIKDSKPLKTMLLVEENIEEVNPNNLSNPLDLNRAPFKQIFHAGNCHICNSINTSITCKKCKMIFYCGENHQKDHWPEHKSICKVILGILNETGAPNLFDKLKTQDEELWLKAKIDLMKKAELKIGRKLSDEELGMFLYPKTCLTCHESDLSVLRKCICGMNFCRMHVDNAKHKELCQEFKLCRRLMIKDVPFLKAFIEVMPKKNNIFPSSMVSFIDSYLQPKKESVSLLGFEIPNLMNILLSDSLTRVFTFIYSVDILSNPACIKHDSFVVHVIGSSWRECYEIEYWKFVLHWFEHLKKLTIIFIGPEISVPLPRPHVTIQFDFHTSTYVQEKYFNTLSYPLRYEDYYKSKTFIHPDIVIGFNLNIHESELGISECTWKDTIRIISEMKVPFIMTSGSKARARKDEKRFATLLGKTVNCTISEDNPYASLVPKRDFESEGICYPNKHILIYTKYPVIHDEPSKPSELDVKVTVIAKNLKSEINAGEEIIIEKSVKDANSKSEMKLKTEKVKGKSLEVGNTECEVELGMKNQKPKQITLNTEIKLEVKSNGLLEDESILSKKNRLLRDENEQLKKENLKLSHGNEKLRKENQSMKDIRQ